MIAMLNCVTTSAFRSFEPLIPSDKAPFRTVTGLNLERKKAG